jgi:hypothetical protein
MINLIKKQTSSNYQSYRITIKWKLFDRSFKKKNVKKIFNNYLKERDIIKRIKN